MCFCSQHLWPPTPVLAPQSKPVLGKTRIESGITKFKTPVLFMIPFPGKYAIDSCRIDLIPSVALERLGLHNELCA